MTVAADHWSKVVPRMREEIGRPPINSRERTGVQIPYFGEELVEYRQMPDGSVADMHQVVRTQGTWAVAAAFDPKGSLILVAQYKFGRDDYSLQMSPGGAGRECPPHATDEELIAHARRMFRRETGMDSENWEVLLRAPVDDNKFRASDGIGSFDAHMLLALDVVEVEETEHLPTDIIKIVRVPADELWMLMEDPYFDEISARLCLYEAMRHQGTEHLLAKR